MSKNDVFILTKPNVLKKEREGGKEEEKKYMGKTDRKREIMCSSALLQRHFPKKGLD